MIASIVITQSQVTGLHVSETSLEVLMGQASMSSVTASLTLMDGVTIIL